VSVSVFDQTPACGHKSNWNSVNPSQNTWSTQKKKNGQWEQGVCKPQGENKDVVSERNRIVREICGQIHNHLQDAS